ncbi:hypothetical protein AVEN_9315-1 [Araneus ventricosus]|uniref:Uncharacterized protein n=1 Tax=Araneus ventricosus TaxID=182803 RepID=A0A4Y2R248_ARAVE|nr:hypothetical protein AVEN_9315-1 [Araneus ventricosus]
MESKNNGSDAVSLSLYINYLGEICFGSLSFSTLPVPLCIKRIRIVPPDWCFFVLYERFDEEKTCDYINASEIIDKAGRGTVYLWLPWYQGTLNYSHCNSSSTEDEVLVAITCIGPTPTVGGTYYYWKGEKPNTHHYCIFSKNENPLTYPVISHPRTRGGSI